MTAPFTNQQVSPDLQVKEIKDTYIRRNFQNMADYFKLQNQLLNFKFFDLTFTKAQSNILQPHGLSYIPQDILVTQVTGNSYIQFNNGLFDKTNLNITVFGACRIRFFVGTYWNLPNSKPNEKTDLMQFYPSVAALVKSGVIATSGTTSSTSTSTSSVTWVAGGNGNIINAPLTVAQISSGLFVGSTQTSILQRIGDSNYICDCTSGAINLTLFPPSKTTGIPIQIKKVDTSLANSVTINGTAIKRNGAIVSSTTLNTVDESVLLISDGTNYNEVTRKSKTSIITSSSLSVPAVVTGSGGNPTLGTTSTNIFEYYRDGEYAVYHIQYAATAGGAAGTAIYLFQLLDSLTINTTRIPVNTNTTSPTANAPGNAEGLIQLQNGSTVCWVGPVVHSTNQVHFAGYGSGPGAMVFGSAAVNFTFATNPIVIGGWFRVPILGWNV